MTAAEYRQTFSAAEWRQLAGDRHDFVCGTRRAHAARFLTFPDGADAPDRALVAGAGFV